MANKANPNTGNVAQFPGEFAEKPDEWHAARVAELKPSALGESESLRWDIVAFELSKIGRLKSIYVDVIAEYCRVAERMAQTIEYLDQDDVGWTYITTGRHGRQIKSRPEVAQYNDDWRKWRSLISELGLSPAAEKSLNASQGDLFGPNPFNGF